MKSAPFHAILRYLSKEMSKITADEVNQNSIPLSLPLAGLGEVLRGFSFDGSSKPERGPKSRQKSKRRQNAQNRLFLRPLYPSNNLISVNLYQVSPTTALSVGYLRSLIMSFRQLRGRRESLSAAAEYCMKNQDVP